jgi:hypothetical protein
VTHDPWTLHASLSCPACHVIGKVVTCEDYDAEPPFVCCDCGSSWVDTGSYADESLKECRTNMMRLVEGMPYEAPRPKEPEPVAPALDLSKLKKTSSAWPPFVIATGYVATAPSDSVGYALSMDTWHMPADIPLSPSVVIPEPPADAEPGSLTITGVDQRNGIITVRYDKK